MDVCLSFFIAIDHFSILACAAIAAGLYFVLLGFHLLGCKRLLLNVPASKIGSAARGLFEVNGVAAGPDTTPAPITGEPCLLSQTTVWQQCEGNKEAWEKVADETLHMPFFLVDSTGELLIEPHGADLDLHPDFREEYPASLSFSHLGYVPPQVITFFSRHDIGSTRNLRIEERVIKPGDALFITGTLAENPVRLFSPGSVDPNDARSDSPRGPVPHNFPHQSRAPEVIRLNSGAIPSISRDMSQQAKIAAALTRAGIAGPQVWASAAAPSQAVGVEENAPPLAVSAGAEMRLHDVRLHDARPAEARPEEDQSEPSAFDLTPPVVLMKGESDSAFVISFRSQNNLVRALAWKAAALISGGTAIALFGFYNLLAQMELL
ncbi:MAG: GIDE domain-containing protein [Terriglobales bacterium]